MLIQNSTVLFSLFDPHQLKQEQSPRIKDAIIFTVCGADTLVRLCRLAPLRGLREVWAV